MIGNEEWNAATSLDYEDSSSFSCDRLTPERVAKSTSILAADLTPIKSGEIMRTVNGKYSFLCVECNSVSDDCLQMINHIDSHFDVNNSIVELSGSPNSSPEFVSCAITTDASSKAKTTTVRTDTLCELTNRMPKPLNLSDISEILNEPSEWNSNCKSGAKYTFNASKIANAPVAQKMLAEIPHAKIHTANLQNSALSAGHPYGGKWDIKYQKMDDDMKKPRLTLSKDLKKPPSPEMTTTRPSIVIELNTRRLKCVYCQESFSNYLEYQIHFKEEHDENDEKCFQCEMEPNESHAKRHKCIYCQNWYPDHLAYESHFKEIHNKIATKCYQCEMEPPISNQSDPRPHKCLFCSEWFSNHIEFQAHFKNKHGISSNYFFSFPYNCYEFTCYICHKDFRLRDYLCQHMRIHSDKYLAHQCPTCGIRVRSTGALTGHMKTHAGITYKCDQCNKVFPYYARLRCHRLCHNTELNYVCKLCSKGFKMKKYLARHMAIHKEAKIRCRYCDATFHFSSCRRAHEKSQHNIV